jgi:chromosome segregation ATPase
MNGTDSIILASIGSIIAFITAQKWIFPLFIKLWDWIINKKKEIDQKNLDVTDEIHKIRMNENEYYEETFNTLLGQIEKLEDELKSYSNELTKLRNEILQLNAKLYNKSIIILDLQKKCCLNENCKMRVCCENKIETLID